MKKKEYKIKEKNILLMIKFVREFEKIEPQINDKKCQKEK